MSDFLRDPPRWKDRTDQARLAERAAGQMVRGLGTAAPLSGPQLACIAARIRAQRSRPHRLRFWVPATAVLLFGGVAAASAAHIDILPRWLIEIVRPGAVAPTPRMPAPRVPRLKPSSPAPAPAPAQQAPATLVQPIPALEVSRPVQPVVAPLPATVPRPGPGERVGEPIRKAASKVSETKPSQPAETKPTQSAETARSPVILPVQSSTSASQPLVAPSHPPLVPSQPPLVPSQPPVVVWPVQPIGPTPPTTQLAWVDQRAASRPAEPARTISDTRSTLPAPASPGGGPIKYLSSAVHALRVAHSPEAALALLDRYTGDLEKSSVCHEALLLRVEAMLKLNRKSEVLQFLDAAPLAGVAASRTLLLTRGELRASVGRCPEAVMDFDLVLVQTQGHNQRALAGRAKCQKPADGKASAGAQEPGLR